MSKISKKKKKDAETDSAAEIVPLPKRPLRSGRARLSREAGPSVMETELNRNSSESCSESDLEPPECSNMLSLTKELLAEVRSGKLSTTGIIRSLKGLLSMEIQRDAIMKELREERDEWKKAHSILLNSIVPSLKEAQRKASVRSYSSVVGAGSEGAGCPPVMAQGQSFAPKPARESVRLFCASAKDSAETIRALKSSLDIKKAGIKVDMIRPGRDGSAIVFTSRPEDGRTLVAMPELAAAGITAKISKPRLPRVIVFNVPKGGDGELIRELYKQNLQGEVQITEQDFVTKASISHRAGPRDGPSHVVVSVPPEVRNHLVSRGRIHLDWQSYRVRDFVGVTLCHKCCLYGHPEKYCREESQTCGHCGKIGHKRGDCPLKNRAGNCATCAHFKRPSNDHVTGDAGCPAREAAVAREASRTSYQ